MCVSVEKERHSVNSKWTGIEYLLSLFSFFLSASYLTRLSIIGQLTKTQKRSPLTKQWLSETVNSLKLQQQLILLLVTEKERVKRKLEVKKGTEMRNTWQTQQDCLTTRHTPSSDPYSVTCLLFKSPSGFLSFTHSFTLVHWSWPLCTSWLDTVLKLLNFSWSENGSQVVKGQGRHTHTHVFSYWWQKMKPY